MDDMNLFENIPFET